MTTLWQLSHKPQKTPAQQIALSHTAGEQPEIRFKCRNKLLFYLAQKIIKIIYGRKMFIWTRTVEEGDLR